MANSNVKAKITTDVKITIELSIDEAGALDAIVGYGFEAFANVFYEKLGKAYLKPYDKGAVSLFETLKEQIPSSLNKAKQIVEAVSKINL